MLPALTAADCRIIDLARPHDSDKILYLAKLVTTSPPECPRCGASVKITGFLGVTVAAYCEECGFRCHAESGPLTDVPPAE